MPCGWRNNTCLHKTTIQCIMVITNLPPIDTITNLSVTHRNVFLSNEGPTISNRFVNTALENLYFEEKSRSHSSSNGLYLRRLMPSSPKSTSTATRHMLTRLRPKQNINISAINSLKVPQAPLVS